MKNLKTFEQFTHEEEIIDEGIKDFFRGGSKEEIKGKEDELTAKLDSLVKKAEDKKYEVMFKDAQNMDKSEPFNKENALKAMGDNNFLGTLDIVPQGKKAHIIYKAGKKGMAKLASGSGSQTTGE